MKKKTKKEKKPQVIEIHIYVHPTANNNGWSVVTTPAVPFPNQQPCRYCGKVGQHTCTIC